MIHSNGMDWQEHIIAGRTYLKTASSGRARPTVFTNELIYQLTAMAIENLLVGIWQYHRQMPFDHTLDGLVDGLAQICPLENDLADNIKEIGRFDNMCPLVPVHRVIPNDAEIMAMLTVGQHVSDFVRQKVEDKTESDPTFNY
jgi:hypothetical protein